MMMFYLILQMIFDNDISDYIPDDIPVDDNVVIDNDDDDSDKDNNGNNVYNTVVSVI